MPLTCAKSLPKLRHIQQTDRSAGKTGGNLMIRRLLALLLLTFSAAAAFAQIDKGSIEPWALDQANPPFPALPAPVPGPEPGFRPSAVPDPPAPRGSPRFH